MEEGEEKEEEAGDIHGGGGIDPFVSMFGLFMKFLG